MKKLKYHAERSKYPFHPGVDIFSLQSGVKRMCVTKKSHPAGNLVCVHIKTNPENFAFLIVGILELPSCKVC